MRIRTASRLAKHARYAVLNVQTNEIVELHTTRKAAQSACDEMHLYANVTNWMKVGRNPEFQSCLPVGTDLMMLDN
jgi:hypothetical protein